MNCKKCIKNPVWNKFFPRKLLIVCFNCNEVGIEYRKIYQLGSYFAILMYLVTKSLSFHYSLLEHIINDETKTMVSIHLMLLNLLHSTNKLYENA